MARFGLVAGLLVALALWALTAEQTGVPAVPLAGLIGLAPLQVLTGASASPVWTLQAGLIGAALAGVLVFVRSRASDRGAALRLASAVLAVALAQAAYGAVSWAAGPTQVYGRTRPDITMPFGSFVNHNHFAGFVEMAALLALGMAAGHARRARSLTPASVGLAGLSLALAAALVASRSRGGILAFTGGALVCGALATRLWASEAGGGSRRRSALAGAALAALVVGFALLTVTPAARQRLATLLTGPGDGSVSYRLDTARATLRLFLDAPLLGSGVGAFEDAVPPFKTGHGDVRSTHAESDMLEFAAEAGLAGLLVLAAWAWLLWASFRRRLETGRDPFRKGLAVGAFSGAAALAFHSLVDFNLRIPSNALLFVTLLGLASAPVADGEPSGRRILAPGVLAGLLVLLAGASAWRAHGAYSYERAVAAADTNERLAALDGVVRLHPYLAEAWRARAIAWRDLAVAPSPLRPARLERAERDLGRALGLRPLWSEAWADRGWVCAMRGDLAPARSHFARARQLDPTHAGIELVAGEFERRTRR